LRTTDWSVARVCIAVGLSGVGSFTTSFGRFFGMSPTAYRASFPSARRHVWLPLCVIKEYGRPEYRTNREDNR
jgi:AraC-like DNA-binding protein